MKAPTPFQQVIASAPTLTSGDRHPAMASVQRFLSCYGYLQAGYRTSTLDEMTSAALAEYQRFSHLPQTGVLTAETRNRMAIPRCAHPDPVGATRFVTACPWDRLELTFAFDSGTEDIPGSREHEAVRNALRTWAATGYFLFREVQRNENPQLLIGWRPPTDPDGWLEDGALAHADFPPACSVVPPASSPLPVHFNEDVNWGLAGVPPYVADVETVALHEIGHCLGLQHSSVEGAIMSRSLLGEQRTLHPDDLAGLAALYGSKDARQLAYSVVVRTRQHFGNLPSASAGQSKDFSFDCPGIEVDSEALLTFQARHVDHEQNILTINGQIISGGLPVTAGEEAWAGQTMLIRGGVLKPKDNTLHVESRAASGAPSGNIDDFILDNVTVWYPILERGRIIVLSVGPDTEPPEPFIGGSTARC